MFSKVALVALAAGAQISFAAPVRQEERSLKAIGTALAGGAASLLTGAILNNKREESGLMVDTETGVIYMSTPDAPDARSLKAVGIAVAGGIASGAAGAIASDLLGKRDPTSGLMVDTETGVIYADMPDDNEGRSLKAVGVAVAGGIASGAAGAIASDLLGKRDELSGLMVDTETGTIFVDVPDAVEDRSLTAIGNFISGIFNKRGEELDERSFSAIGHAIAGFLDQNVHTRRGEELDARSLKAIGNFFSGLFNKRGEELDARSFSAIGDAITDFLDENVHVAKRGEELDARSLTAIENFFGGLFNKRDEPLDARSITAIKNFVGGLFNKRDEPLDARSLTAIGNFFSGLFTKRGQDLDARSLSAIEGFFGNLFNKRSELEESMAKRAINDLE